MIRIIEQSCNMIGQ